MAHVTPATRFKDTENIADWIKSTSVTINQHVFFIFFPLVTENLINETKINIPREKRILLVADVARGVG